MAPVGATTDGTANHRRTFRLAAVGADKRGADAHPQRPAHKRPVRRRAARPPPVGRQQSSGDATRGATPTPEQLAISADSGQFFRRRGRGSRNLEDRLSVAFQSAT
jgi:hypothetical protein